MYEYLRSGAYEPHVEELRAIYRERRDTALAAVMEHCGDYLHGEVPAGGFFLWLHLTGGLDAVRLFEAAQALGVAVTPGRGYYANGGGEHEIRLVFSALPPEQLRAAIALLGKACVQAANAARA